MKIIKRLRALAAVLAGLGITTVALASAAPASMALLQPPVTDAGTAPAPVVHTLVVGGTPGWQITLIALGAALIAGTVAVLADRARSARRRAATVPA